MNDRTVIQAVWSLTALALGALVLYGVLAALGRNLDGPTTLVFTIVGTCVPAIAALLTIGRQTSKIEQNTNGNLRELLNMVQQRDEWLAKAQPVQIDSPIAPATGSTPGGAGVPDAPE